MTQSIARLAIFDCDGTLVDSQANICRALEEAFSEARVEIPPRERIRRAVGLSLIEVMRALLPDAPQPDHHRLAQAYRDKFANRDDILPATNAVGLDFNPPFDPAAAGDDNPYTWLGFEAAAIVQGGRRRRHQKSSTSLSVRVASSKPAATRAAWLQTWLRPCCFA